MKTKIYLSVILSVALVSVTRAQVSPEIELGAKGVMSGNIVVDNANTASAVSDFSDSQILLGFKQKLYSAWRGQMVFGFQFPDADSDLGQVFFNHVFLTVENHKNIFKLGRSTTKTIINEFPTLRDDDAISFNYSLNPFSIGSNTQDNQYGNVIEYTHIFRQRYWFTFHGENLANLSSPTDFSLNAFGASFLYIVPGSQRWNRNVLQRIGMSYNNYLTDRPGYSGYEEALKNILGTVTINVFPDPVHFVDFRIQGIYNIGFSEIDSINSYRNYVKTPYFSTFGTVRYLYRKLERPFIQVSAGMGYKSFSSVAGSNQFIGITNIFYRLGEHFDLGFQYRYLHNYGETGSLFGQKQHRFQLALVYSIDQIFNNQFDDRNSILNLEHGYIK
ncbi:MAG: hypothetical protein GXO83_00420 [Chlorobi bacterium]|nr:hypothetical protein [Chlorobiota bacterium]